MRFYRKLIFLAALGSTALAYGMSEVNSLDLMINHQKSSLERMKSYTDKTTSKEVRELNDRLVAAEKKELEQMLSLRKKIAPQHKENLADEFFFVQHELETEMRRLQEDTAKLFTRFGLHERTHNPRIEIVENENSYDIKAEIPGISREAIEVKLVKQDLTIKGEKKVEIKKEEKGISSTEISYGEFSRTIHLKENVDAASMKTTYKDGVLQVHIEKAKTRKAQQASIY
jgi:HSP20 family protein